MTRTERIVPAGDLRLGLDTGGTYTDAVILRDGREIIASAKSLTTKQDLSIGLAGAIRAVIGKLPDGLVPADINLVSISTTLATNAVVENKRNPICAILIGYDQAMLARAGLQEALRDSPVVLIAGGHRATGEENAALDEDAARAAILEHAPRVDAFAISSLFSVRNPSHEARVRQLVRELTHKPVTCGHELTSHLDAPRRALTTALNAQLTPQLRQLMEAVGVVLSAVGIDAPLMVVKGDGSLMTAEVALECPVETILSGPAASVVGAKFLTGFEDFIVSDMGGTTTDIAVVRGGKPVLNNDGALVGGWSTMVQAVDVRTFGLGGDSEVAFDRHGRLTIGPRRVVPLSLLATTWPTMLEKLRAQMAMEPLPLYSGRFAFRQTSPSERQLLSKSEQSLWEALQFGPRALSEIVRSPSGMRTLNSLVGRGLVALSGMTPSDAMHVLGEQHDWNVEAARLGAALLIREERDHYYGARRTETIDENLICGEIREQVVQRTGRALYEATLAQDPGMSAANGSWGQLGDAMIEKLVSGQTFSTLVKAAMSLELPLIAIGAPVRSYYPQVAQRLNAQLVIPEHAAVSNAVGAVAGVVMQTVEILVNQPALNLFRVHEPDGLKDFGDAEAALARARAVSRELAHEAARRAGAMAPVVETIVEKKSARQLGGEEYLAEAIVRSTATGRPMVAEAGQRAALAKFNLA